MNIVVGVTIRLLVLGVMAHSSVRLMACCKLSVSLHYSGCRKMRTIVLLDGVLLDDVMLDGVLLDCVLLARCWMM